MIDKYGYSRIYNFFGTEVDHINEYIKKEHYGNLIKWLVNLTNCQSYLEIGVDAGDCIHQIRDVVKKCVAVDWEDKMVDKDKIIFHNMSSDDFFENHNKDTYDIIFIDGGHTFGQVKQDFENSLKVLNEFGILIFHDTDPSESILTHINYCADAYKIIDYIMLRHPELNVMTFPIHETGLSFAMRKSDRRCNKFSDVLI